MLFVILRSYPSLERALRKNGSWTAYLLSSLLLEMQTAAWEVSAVRRRATHQAVAKCYRTAGLISIEPFPPSGALISK